MGKRSRHLNIVDTTLRDGEQTQGVSFSPAEKVNIAKALLELLKVDRIEVASARVSEGEKEAVANIVEWADTMGLGDRVEVLGFVDFKKSVELELRDYPEGKTREKREEEFLRRELAAQSIYLSQESPWKRAHIVLRDVNDARPKIESRQPEA